MEKGWNKKSVEYHQSVLLYWFLTNYEWSCVRGNRTTGTNDVRGNRTTGTNATKHGHSYSVCITNSNGKPNVIKAIKATRYRQSSLNYLRSPLTVSRKEKDLSCDKRICHVTISGLEIRNNL